MLMKNETYDLMKKIALYILPAIATLWLTLGKIWNLPYTAEIGATITAIDVFLGACLGISTKHYNEILEDAAEKGMTD